MSAAPRIAVFDYESGNVHSAVKALVAAGADAVLTRDRSGYASYFPRLAVLAP